MKVLAAHNYYQYQGGEDSVFSNEKELLRRRGHEVVEFVRDNHEITSYGVTEFAALPARTIWNWDSYDRVKKIIKDFKPDVVHLHNTFPLISPAVYDACWDCNVPVVQTLHNSRLFCPAGGLFYKGEYCERCLGKTLPWAGIARGCYRSSHLQTGLVGIMTAVHRKRGTWTDKVARYVVFNSFFKQKFIEAGLPAAKIDVKPHFLDDPGEAQVPGAYALYVGRLSDQKGVRTLLRAWESVGNVPLRICGSGPLEAVVSEAAAKSGGKISHTPFAPREAVLSMMKGASFLIWPSEAVETFGLVALEAFACGRPVVCSALSSMLEMVSENQTGISFQAGNSDDLARKVMWAWQNKEEMVRMGRAARKRYEADFSTDSNYDRLIQIYHRAIESVTASAA